MITFFSAKLKPINGMNYLLAVCGGLTAAVLWSVSNILLKKSLSQSSSSEIAAFVYSGIGSVILAISTVSLDLIGYMRFPVSKRAIFIFICAGIIGTGLGRIFSYIAVDKVGISIQSSFVSVNPVIATAIAWIGLQENITSLQLLGLLISVTGLVIISYSNGGNVTGWKKTALGYSILTPILYGTASVVRRYGLQNTDLEPVQAVTINEITALCVVTVYIVTKKESTITTELQESNLILLSLAGVCNTIAITALYISLKHGPVIIGTTTSSLTTVFVLIITGLCLKDIEKITQKQIFGTILTIIGVVLVVL